MLYACRKADEVYVHLFIVWILLIYGVKLSWLICVEAAVCDLCEHVISVFANVY